MKLIIDCGSTKAEWVLIEGSKEVDRTITSGFNPNYTSENDISSITLNNITYNTYNKNITDIFFYGSGCANEKNSTIIGNIFRNIFPNSKINIFCDMMAACHALYHRKDGIAAILGTGSNSCLYRNGEIIKRTISLGYILGDEGSGSHLGKQLLKDYFYEKMPPTLREEFYEKYKLNRQEMINNIYKESQVSMYIASFVPFAHENIDNEYIIELCRKSFNDFIENHIIRFLSDESDNIGIIGSIAYYFSKILLQCFDEYGLPKPTIMKSPMKGLIKYHENC